MSQVIQALASRITYHLQRVNFQHEYAICRGIDPGDGVSRTEVHVFDVVRENQRAVNRLALEALLDIEDEDIIVSSHEQEQSPALRRQLASAELSHHHAVPHATVQEWLISASAAQIAYSISARMEQSLTIAQTAPRFCWFSASEDFSSSGKIRYYIIQQANDCGSYAPTGVPLTVAMPSLSPPTTEVPVSSTDTRRAA